MNGLNSIRTREMRVTSPWWLSQVTKKFSYVFTRLACRTFQSGTPILRECICGVHHHCKTDFFTLTISFKHQPAGAIPHFPFETLGNSACILYSLTLLSIFRIRESFANSSHSRLCLRYLCFTESSTSLDSFLATKSGKVPPSASSANSGRFKTPSANLL